MAPSLAFHGQPYDEDATIGAFLARALSSSEFDRLTVVVAWARFRGLRRITADLDGFAKRGGTSRLIVGIDEGIATRPGLLLALKHFNEVFVLHDTPGITFHPKLYLAEGNAAAALLVGSGNLTAGGLYSNYEASLEATFQLPAEDGDPALSDARAYVESLLSDSAICLPLDPDLLERLVENPRYAVSKREPRRTRKEGLPDGLEPEDVDPTAEESGTQAPDSSRLFGKSSKKKAPIPPLPAGAQQELRDLEGDEESTPPVPAPAGAQPSNATGSPSVSTPAPVVLPPEMAEMTDPVLIAELSKSRGGPSQANFHVEHFTEYFGAQKDQKRPLTLRQVLLDGSLEPDEPRETVPVASQNYRFEVNGLRGHDYPDGDLAPIAIFLQREADVYLYRVLWPEDRAYPLVTTYLDKIAGARTGRRRMRQKRTTVEGLSEAWPQNPFLAALAAS